MLPAAPPAGPGPYNWSGAYVGANVGGGFADVSSTATAAGLSATATAHLSGIVGGGQVGINWQMGQAVLGVEADFQGTGQTNTAAVGAFSASDRLTYFGTLRGRAGFAIDRWLPYLTAGWGYGGWSSVASVGGLGAVSLSTWQDFWVVGGGLELAIWGPLTGKIEYLYLNTGTIATTAAPLSFNTTLRDNIFRVGLNYRY